MLEVREYTSVCDYVQPGDIIAFGGYSPFSLWAKLTTLAVVTHVAIVIEPQPEDETGHRFCNRIMEATDYGGKRGVMTNQLSERVSQYDGDIWWLPLSPVARARFENNKREFYKFMLRQKNKGYDILQLFGAAVDFLDTTPMLGQLTFNKQDFSSWFCSELIAEGLRAAGVVRDINASEVTPIDICRFAIFNDTYVQIKGQWKPITGFNSEQPSGWGLII
ncbi:hypothetical protein DXV75_14020 [Alteromonas aestuariivivens]|uniref:Uncharacterized protein n=1 Tax=Alteromonas aestuariivivens TaxID=1938339 RepID=A0A3D8M3M6_9ALTE|nr:hypothetical protein [Alteromonas aestuariivivens]RDV24333.1 hypothetical protein DXV75_14020 [Alteromonas aestuariivivens]